MSTETVDVAGLEGGLVAVPVEDLEALAARMESPLLRPGDAGWDDAVLIWNGMAAKIPAAVLQPGSAAGVVEAVRFAAERGLLLSIKGGGHKLAAGVTLRTDKIPAFRKSVNDFYRQNKLENQQRHLDPKEDICCKELMWVSEDFVVAIESCQPFGHGNPEPVLLIQDVKIKDKRHMGDRKQHVKITVMDNMGKVLQLVAFSRAHEFEDVEVGDPVHVWAEVELNEWRGARSVQGRLRKMIKVDHHG